jgi:hypothetical protein
MANRSGAVIAKRALGGEVTRLRGVGALDQRYSNGSARAILPLTRFAPPDHLG